MLSNSSGPAEPHGALPAGYQLGFLLLAAVAAVPPVCVARDIVAGRRGLSPVDEILLVRQIIIAVWKPLTNVLVLVRDRLPESVPPAVLHPLCFGHGVSIVTGVGLVSIANFLLSFSRIQQLLASRLSRPLACLTEHRIRWQNRALMAASLIIFVSMPLCADMQPSAYFWCMDGSEPKRPPMLLLLSINSGVNCVNFCFSIYLWRVSSGLPDTPRPRNYIPANCWAQLCFVIIVAKTLLVPLNTDNFGASQKVYLNHVFFTVLYGLLDPCLLLFMAARWRQQVRDCRLHNAQTRQTRKTNAVVPIIRLHLI
ncbi:hypothetical protein FJT64_019091 [Amphibalanus amphitrite]|uniref:G-protein coupled receptors family 1 profile domain-containing protein n=1 Tax=Amphibalanus amphitrite TaxID=1232801 RepID=A0A6A4WRB6_AMPAM|nr:hypothetical protein FJT64_019091 [Amphibalanus amphitrite]